MLEDRVYSVSFPATLTFEATSVSAARRAAEQVAFALFRHHRTQDGVLTGCELEHEGAVGAAEVYDPADLRALLALGGRDSTPD